MTTDIRKSLAELLTGKADWREVKASEHPEDDRNLESAKRLRELADYVLSLSPDDARLSEFVDPWMLFSSKVSHVAGRVGFDNLDDNLDAALARIAAATIRPAVDDMTALGTREWLDIAEDPDRPMTGLEAVGLLYDWLVDRERELVLAGRVEGMSWAHIALCLDRSKQAVWEKYHDADPSDTAET